MAPTIALISTTQQDPTHFYTTFRAHFYTRYIAHSAYLHPAAGSNTLPHHTAGSNALLNMQHMCNVYGTIGTQYMVLCTH